MTTQMTAVYKMNGHHIELFWYLRFMVFKDGDLDKWVNELIRKARTALFMLRQYQSRWHQTVIDKLRDFQVLIEPILEYPCETWGYKHQPKVESFYNDYFKMLLGLKPSTPSFM